MRLSAADPLTTAGLFLARAGRLATTPLVHYHRDGRWQDVSWIELQEQALRIASGLVVAGVVPGDRVLLLAENRVEWLACDLGIQLAAAATVPIHPSATPHAAQAIARDSGAVLAIVSGAEAAARLHLTDVLGRIVRLEGEVARWLRAPFAEGPAGELVRRLARLGPEDAATVVFAGGAAPPATGVVVAHRTLVQLAWSRVAEHGIGVADVVLSFLPYADVSERLWGIYVPLAAGATVWVSRGVHALDEDVHVARPTVVNCVPPVLEGIRRRVDEERGRRPAPRRAVEAWALAAGRERAVGRAETPWLRLRHGLAERLVLASLRRGIGGGRLRFFTSGGAPLEPGVDEFFAAVGLPVHQGWGRSATMADAIARRRV